MSNELELRLAKRIRSDLIGLESDEEIFEKTLQLLLIFFHCLVSFLLFLYPFKPISYELKNKYSFEILVN